MQRRHFLHAGLGLIAAPSLIPASQETDRKKRTGLWHPLTEEEIQAMDGSVMADDVLNFAGKGYNCAETALIVCLRHVNQPESRVHAASCFGGGMGYGAACGLLTGGLMGIGFAGGLIGDDRKAMKAWAAEKCAEYRTWFSSLAPTECRDLKRHYSGREEYLNMARRVAWKLETLLQETVS